MSEAAAAKRTDLTVIRMHLQIAGVLINEEEDQPDGSDE